MEIRKLTEEQEKKPYAKYFSMFMDEYGVPDNMKAITDLTKPLDPNNVLKITDIDKLLDPNYDSSRHQGWCLLPDGTGYVGQDFFYPGVTSEMFCWWFAWHGLEDTRYRIWDPKGHYGIKVSQRHMKKRLDQSLSWEDRNYGTTDYVMAYTADGISVVKICFLSPEDFGFNPELIKKSGLKTINTVSGKPDELNGNGPSIRVLIDTPEGLIAKIYFWYGYTIIDKKPVRLNDYILDPNVVKIQTTHCAEEYTRLGKILPLVYAENVNVIDKAEDIITMPF